MDLAHWLYSVPLLVDLAFPRNGPSGQDVQRELDEDLVYRCPLIG